MKEKKTKTFIYEGLGFPIRLVNVPLRKTLGEWVLDINLNQFQIAVLQILIRKPTSLTGAELHFIRSYLELSTHSFAEIFGVTHVAVLKWESEESKMNPGTELCIRLYVLDQLHGNDKEFRKLFSLISLKDLSKKQKKSVLEINAEEQHLLAS